MTKEEARKKVSLLRHCLEDYEDFPLYIHDEDLTALDMAISALSEKDSTMRWKGIYDRTEIGGNIVASLCGFECSKCNKQAEHMYDFCPHCGRKRVNI